MPVFVVNRELAGISMEQLAEAQKAAIATSERFRAEGRDVRYLRSMFVPSTGQCRCLFEGADGDVVTQVQDAAGLPYEEVLEALDLAPAES